MEVWRLLAQDFDIFFGFESANNTGLAAVQKETEISASLGAVRLARSLGYGVKRFLELYAEAWRRSILNTSGEKR